MTDGPRQDSDSRALAGSGTAAIIRGPADVSRSEIFMECHTRCEEPVTVRGVCVGMLAEQNDQRPRADATPSPGWLAFWPAVPKPRSRLLPPALFSSQCEQVEGRVSPHSSHEGWKPGRVNVSFNPGDVGPLTKRGLPGINSPLSVSFCSSMFSTCVLTSIMKDVL